nr:immunoglobulin heavy chain junction region [Macaca mulatta]MOW45469.1 immunoglobulin heavy chain junction region [Macaca mulatta]MOW45536.1 immunoglobulin heavy chain junction region [Macaca mulatta]MOW45538.1 immunoglobulin heavy chain junction region [Macaca mulatta]MOW45604.1 immunoglobulin heavy chain junction region [Macaca mulatta]
CASGIGYSFDYW